MKLLKLTIFTLLLSVSLITKADNVNIAPLAATVQTNYTATQNRINAINDGITGFGELPANKVWTCLQETNTMANYLIYNFDQLYSFSSAKVWFWTNSETPGEDVMIPGKWAIQYYCDSTSTWVNVNLLDTVAGYPYNVKSVNEIKFETVKAHRLRIYMTGQTPDSVKYSAVGVSEWQVFADENEIPKATDEINIATRTSGVSALYTTSGTNLYSIYDGIKGFQELSASEYWCNYKESNRTASSYIEFNWEQPQTIDSLSIWWWSNTDKIGDNTAVPASWDVLYFDLTKNTFQASKLATGSSYQVERFGPSGVKLQPVTTTKIRIRPKGQRNITYSAVGISEVEIYSPTAQTSTVEYGDYPIEDVALDKVKLSDSFWSTRVKQNQSVTIPAALKQCNENGSIDNFFKAAAIIEGKNIGYATGKIYSDADVYELIEAASNSIKSNPNTDLEKELEDLVTIITEAQESDGYLFTARTAADPSADNEAIGTERWKNDPEGSYELYCCGHLYEAAVAYCNATGSKALLNVAVKNADLLVKVFLDGGLRYEPGHQIVEKGLVELYRATNNAKYMELARYFLDLRGTAVGHDEYNQTHKPVIGQDEAVGHAVSAAYMYSGMADVAAVMGSSAYSNALDNIWNNVVGKKYYLTGGIGSSEDDAAFGSNYELPNESAYSETCASIANIDWNWRMFRLHGDSKYIDVIERTLYNGALAGISLDGKSFFSSNRLESNGDNSRDSWLDDACCPTNICNFIASVPGYAYAVKHDSVYVNLYMQSTADLDINNKAIQLTQTTEYPWQGKVEVAVSKTSGTPFTLMLRIPGWFRNQPVPSNLYSYTNADTLQTVLSDSVLYTLITLKDNGKPVSYNIVDGYLAVTGTWAQGEKFEVEFPMDVKQVLANSNVEADKDKSAFERGPIVYCMESADNKDYQKLVATVGSSASAKWSDDLNGIMEVDVNGLNSQFIDSKSEVNNVETSIRLVPYYAWDNRGADKMQVWISSASEFDIQRVGDVALTDTITIDVWQEANDSKKSVYPSETFALPLDKVTKSLGITSDQFNEMLGGAYLSFCGIDEDGSVDYKTTTSGLGYWFNNSKKIVSWGDDAYSFATLDTAVNVFKYGQYPGKCAEGEVHRMNVAFTYAPEGTGTATHRAVIAINLHIGTESTNSLNIENRRVTAFVNDFLYSRADASGIDNYTSETTYRKDHPNAIKVSWTAPAKAVAQRLFLAENSSMTDAIVSTIDSAASSTDIYNTIPGRKYYYQIANISGSDTTIVSSGSFTPEGQVRMLNIDGIANVRDLGGWMTQTGVRVRYGKIIRGTEVTGNYHKASNIGKIALRNAGILAHMDLRSDGEAGNEKFSEIGSKVDYKRISTTEYNLDSYKTQYKQIFQFILQSLEADKPVYINCIWGCDRTGTLAFLLEGLLGVTESNIYKDYELSLFSNDGLTGRPKSNIDGILDKINKLKGDTLRDRFNTYFTSIGITQEEIDKFRTIMLDTQAEDVNGDGNVDSQDVLKIYEFMKSSTTTPTSTTLEDVNGDGNVDSQDVLKIYDYMKTH